MAILAAGRGTRMRSSLPKVLHRLGSRTLIEHTVITALSLKPERCLVIVGYGREQVMAALQDYPVEFVVQADQRGTGHAVQQLIPHLTDFSGDLLVLNADVPLLRPSTLATLRDTHQQRQVDATLLSAQVSDPTGYGRVLCGPNLRVTQIVEHRDCTPAQLRHNRINGGVYCFHWPRVAPVLSNLTPGNDQQEYYLTDVIEFLDDAVAVDVPDVQELQGINDRLQLSQAYDTLQRRLKTHWMRQGVTMVDPQSITIDDDVQLAADVVIEPQTHLRGQTTIETGCHLGPGVMIESSQIGAASRVLYSVVSHSQIGPQTTVGPFAHVRGQAMIGAACRIGNFVEVKNSTVGAGTNAAHLSYLGDATLGEQVNIGAGTITANFDGVQKHRTTVGDRSKTGANSVLVAPITIGEDVTIAAGSTVTESVGDDCLVIGRSPQVVKPGWRRRSPKPD